MEMYQAYQEGRLTTDPSDNWVKGECGFLDYYVIPLAKKLDTCGVFGVSSDEFLNYAGKSYSMNETVAAVSDLRILPHSSMLASSTVANRKEWEMKGPAMVAEYKQRYMELHGVISKSSRQRDE